MSLAVGLRMLCADLIQCEFSSGVRLGPSLEHGREVANWSNLRRAGIDDREHALKDLGGVVGVDHEEEIVARRIHPGAHHLVDVLGQGVHHRPESDRHGGIVFSRARVLVVVVGDMEEHGSACFLSDEGAVCSDGVDFSRPQGKATSRLSGL